MVDISTDLTKTKAKQQRCVLEPHMFIGDMNKISAELDSSFWYWKFFLFVIHNVITTDSNLCMEKALATHSSTLAWKIPWTEEPGRLQSMGLLESDTTEQLHFYFSLSCIGEGNGNPLQCSCLENPRDGGAWWAAVYGVAQSQKQLKRFSSSSSRGFLSG